MKIKKKLRKYKSEKPGVYWFYDKNFNLENQAIYYEDVLNQTILCNYKNKRQNGISIRIEF